MGNKNKLKKDLILEVAQLHERVKELESGIGESYWHDIVESSPDRIFILNPDLKIQFVNRPSLGLTTEKLVGSPIIKFVVKEKQAEIKAILKEVLKTKQPALYETRYLKPDGEMIYYETQAIPRISTGKVVGLTLSLRDITTRKLVEEENIFNLSPDMLGVFTTAGKLIKVNLAWEKVLGYTQKELLDLDWTELVHPGDVEPTNKTVEKQLEGSSVVNFVNRYKCKDGSYKTLEWQSTHTKEGIVIAIARDITERQRTEQALRKSEELYRSLFDNVPIGLNQTTPEGKILDANPAFLNMLDFPDKETLLAINIQDLHVDLRQRKIWQEEIEQDGVVSRYEYQMKRHDGSPIWVETNTQGFRNTDGDILFYQGSVEDITERVQAEEELQDIFNLSPDMLGVFTTAGKLIKVNLAWEKVLGYTQKELLDLDWTELVHPGDVEPTNKTVEKQLEGSSVVNFVNRYKCKDGSYKTLEWQATHAKEGIVIAIARDITERQRTEQALRESEELYRSLFDNVPIGLNLTTPEGKILDANPAFMNMLNFPDKKTLLAINIQDLHDDLRQRKIWQEEIERDGVVSHYEYQMKRHDGSPIRVSTNTHGFRDADGDILFYQGSVEDITERVQAEEEIRDLAKFPSENPHPVFRISQDGALLYANLAGFKLLGKPGQAAPPVLREAAIRSINSGMGENLVLDFNDRAYSFFIAPVVKYRYANLYGRDSTDRRKAELEKDQLLIQLRMANERLQALSRELINSQEAERKHIAQELHDEFGQSLVAISMNLGIVERDIPPGTTQEIIGRLFETRTIVDELDGRISELALDLRPSLLDDLGLLPTLNWYVERYSQRAEIEVKLDVMGLKTRLSSEIETAFYRIIQEALTNVARHSQAKKVSLQLKSLPTMVTVSIQDDGQGFDTDEIFSSKTPIKSLGLRGMRERVSILGGRLEIHSKPGEGTRIEIELPL